MCGSGHRILGEHNLRSLCNLILISENRIFDDGVMEEAVRKQRIAESLLVLWRICVTYLTDSRHSFIFNGFFVGWYYELCSLLSILIFTSYNVLRICGSGHRPLGTYHLRSHCKLDQRKKFLDHGEDDCWRIAESLLVLWRIRATYPRILSTHPSSKGLFVG